MTIRSSLAIVLSLTLGPVLLAQVVVPPQKPAPTSNTAARASAARAAMLAHSGGIVAMAPSGPSILFLNTQKQTPEAEIRAVTDTISSLLRLSLKVATQETTDPIAEAAKAMADTNVAGVVVIAELPGQPALLIAPENRWALVNCAPLGGKGVSSELRNERVRKEIWRAFGYLMGAGNSNSENCLMRGVRSTADLDALKMKSLSLEPFGKIMSQAKIMGMVPTRMTSYRKAIEEGWAHAPTNDTQKAIWNEVKSGKKTK
jgi:hypothetical protein